MQISPINQNNKFYLLKWIVVKEVGLMPGYEGSEGHLDQVMMPTTLVPFSSRSLFSFLAMFGDKKMEPAGFWLVQRAPKQDEKEC